MKPPTTKITPPPPADFAPHAERVRGADGKLYWKLTCFCGKNLLAPTDGKHVHGRCPKCGRDLLFPPDSSITTGSLPVIPANRPQRTRTAKSAAHQRVNVAPAKAPVSDRDSSKDRIHPGHSASDNAADKLRPRSVRTVRISTALVSAWPSAEIGPRALATFIDLTIVLALFAGLLLASPSLPHHFSSTTFRVAFALIAMWLNEGLLQWLWGGSPGKKVCRIAVREEEGEALTIENALLRPFVKWALLPTWPLIFRDADRRAYHDKILNLLVLKSRH